MYINSTWKMTLIFCMVAVCGLVACNSSDSKTTDSSSSSDSTVKTAGSADSTMKDSAAMAVKTKKKRKASIAMQDAGTDKIMKDKDGVYNRAEQMPEFPGGQDALSAYINNHLDFSQTAVDDNTTGTVRVSFVVDEMGKIVDVALLGDKKLGDGLDEQAQKVITGMPTWKPGKVHGKSVKTRLTLPITFALDS